jgi:hypothetical protein
MKYLVIALVLVLATSAFGLEKKAYQMREDFGSEPLYDCALNYYYYIPCPTYSWFWSYVGWTPGDIVGAFFRIGDVSMYYNDCCCPTTCMDLEEIRVLDFAGYGTVYPGLFTVEFDVYCSDGNGCPIGPSLWNSGPYETSYAYNYIQIDPPISVCECVSCQDPLSFPRILVTATHTGTDGAYPEWGFDNVSTAVETGCPMFDKGGLEALYPRPGTSHYGTMHSGYYGSDFAYCPPLWIPDGADTTPDASQYGFIELAWRIYIVCSGPSAAESSSWGDIKTMYR